MEYRFGLLEGRGWLTAVPEGPRVQCRAELSGVSRGLYKVHLTGRGGSFLLGTLIPEGGSLRLHRTVSLDQLKRQGVWPPEGAFAELAFAPERVRPPAGWVPEGAPARLLGEPLLARCAQPLRGVLLHRRESGFSLAVPWQAGEEFPGERRGWWRQALHGNGLLRTSLAACPAARAAVGVEEELCFEALALRIVAPGAGERAALEKDGGADALAVVEGIFLDIENDAPRLPVFKHAHGVSPGAGAFEPSVAE